jgi:DNA-binding transcriptional LysR family regulator
MPSELDLREIRTFLALAEELHFARAAERLRVTPSRVSQTIRSLEAKVGGPLFERTSRRVRLTPLGERLRDNIAGPYEQLRRGFTATGLTATGLTERLRIGMYMRLSGGPHWHEIVRTFRSRHPSCELKIIDTKPDRNYLDALRNGEVDLLAARLPISDGDLTVGPVLSQEPRVLLVAKEDALAKRESVCLDDFADRPICDSTTLPREMMNAYFPPVTPSGRRFPRIELRSTEEMMMLVAAGKIVHPTVASFLDYYADHAIAAVPISDLPSSQTALVWASTDELPNVRAFARAAADVLAHTELAARTPSHPRADDPPT